MKRGDTKGRLDSWFHHPRYELLEAKLDAARVAAPELREFLVSIAGGATPRRSDSSLYSDDGVKFLRILNIGDGEILERDLKYLTDEVHEGELGRSQLAEGDVLMTITGRVGSAAVVHKQHLPANINQHIVRLRLDEKRCRPQFLCEWLNCPNGLALSNQFVSGGTRAALDYDAVRSLRVPLPDSLKAQDRLLTKMNAARAERREKLVQADRLLMRIDDFIISTLGIARPPRPQSTFAIHTKDLVGVVNPTRYQSRQIEKALPFKNTVHVTGSLVRRKFAPAKDAPDEEFDRIRIDDLPSHPWQAEILRTEYGRSITGSLFEVEENDILLARLGPTILNAKFVLCPKLSRRTVASGEFLVLRCNENHQPEAVLWLLRTSLYRTIMYLRCRGATPSRFRLNGEDLLSIPFPELSDPIQSVITTEIHRCREDVRRLRTTAEAGWQAAKQWFADQVLGQAAL